MILGTDKTRIIVCGPELVVDGSFEESASGWSETSGTANGSTSHFEDDDTYYGNYSLKIFDNDATVRYGAFYEVDYGQALAGLTFLVTWAARSDKALTSRVSILCQDKYVSDTFSPTTSQGRFSAALRIPETAAGTCFYLLFYPCDVVAETGILYLDNVSCRKALYDFEFDQPQEWRQNFRKVTRKRLRMADGRIVESVIGWQYETELSFDYLDDDDETARSRISEGELVVIYPHKDNSFFVPCIWDGDYERDYFENLLVAFSGSIRLVAAELIKEKPV